MKHDHQCRFLPIGIDKFSDSHACQLRLRALTWHVHRQGQGTAIIRRTGVCENDVGLDVPTTWLCKYFDITSTKTDNREAM